jgi:hypothetical protein
MMCEFGAVGKCRCHMMCLENLSVVLAHGNPILARNARVGRPLNPLRGLGSVPSFPPFSGVPLRYESEKGSECHRRSWRPILPQRTRAGWGNHIQASVSERRCGHAFRVLCERVGQPPRRKTVIQITTHRDVPHCGGICPAAKMIAITVKGWEFLRSRQCYARSLTRIQSS